MGINCHQDKLLLLRGKMRRSEMKKRGFSGTQCLHGASTSASTSGYSDRSLRWTWSTTSPLPSFSLTSGRFTPSLTTIQKLFCLESLPPHYHTDPPPASTITRSGASSTRRTRQRTSQHRYLTQYSRREVEENHQ